ncbi:MAG: CDP-alcohol phosphatidyltransferase family protein [Acidobacteria bacterium]|nr:CDP-alcohol phosphatidyltransferase family protein [Acidobacteriota bacterium]
MTRLAALIVTDGAGGSGETAHAARRAVVAGLELTERAVLAAHAAGIDRIHIAGEHLPDERVLQRLRARGLAIVCTLTRGHNPLGAAPLDSTLVVLPVDTLVEPAAIRALLERASLGVGEGALAVDRRPDARHRLLDVSDGRVRAFLADGNAASTGLALLTPEAVQIVRHAPSVWAGFRRLARATKLWAVGVDPHFCERLHDDRDRAGLERQYIRHANGGATESFFTKQIRRLSIPVTRQVLRLPVTANQVTLAGLALSVAAGTSFAVGGYWAGLIGAALYYGSTVLDCSDGEVARATYGESAFGCWLETAADYASYVCAWAGITIAALRTNPQSAYSRAAIVALTSSLLTFAFVAYLRHRVARANPGQFDDALGATLAGESPVHRFSGWARQWIKRSSLAHLLVVLALIGQLKVILFLWAFGGSAAFVLGLLVHRVLVSRVTVPTWRAPSARGATSHA